MTDTPRLTATQAAAMIVYADLSPWVDELEAIASGTHVVVPAAPDGLSRERDGAKSDAAVVIRATEPDVHSYDPSPARRTVTVRWPDGALMHYTLTRIRDGK